MKFIALSDKIRRLNIGHSVPFLLLLLCFVFIHFLSLVDMRCAIFLLVICIRFVLFLSEGMLKSLNS